MYVNYKTIFKINLNGSKKVYKVFWLANKQLCTIVENIY